MSHRRIIVEPRDGECGFNIRYCSHHISLPGYVCEYQETDDWMRKLRKVLPRYGCSPKQVRVIFELLMKQMDECLVTVHAEVDLFPDQEGGLESDSEDDWDSEEESDLDSDSEKDEEEEEEDEEEEEEEKKEKED